MCKWENPRLVNPLVVLATEFLENDLMHNRHHATKPPDISYKTWAVKSIIVFSKNRKKLTISWNTIKKLIEGEKERVSKIELERHFGLIRMQIIKFPYLHNNL